MLTPIEIQGKTFKNGMGYNKADVDGFVSNLSSEYENLYKENISLKERINMLEQSLSHYQEIEKSLQKALVLAQTSADETIVAAKKNAIVIEQEAVLKAQSIVADAKVELDRIHIKTADLLQQYSNYRARYKALASAQLEVLESEAFDLTQSSSDIMDALQKSASENADLLQAVAVNTESVIEPEVTASVEEDFDETLSTGDSIIKDFTDIFSEDKK